MANETHLMLILCLGIYLGCLATSTSHETIVFKNLNQDSEKIMSWGNGAIHFFNRNMDIFINNKFSETSPGVYGFFLGPIALLVSLVAVIATRKRSFVLVFVFILAQHILAFQQGEMLPKNPTEKDAMEVFEITSRVRMFEVACVAMALFTSVMAMMQQSGERLKCLGFAVASVVAGSVLFGSHADAVMSVAVNNPSGLKYANGYSGAVLAFMSGDQSGVTPLFIATFSMVFINLLIRILLFFRFGWFNILTLCGPVGQFVIGTDLQKIIAPLMKDGVFQVSADQASQFYSMVSGIHLVEGRLMLLSAVFAGVDLYRTCSVFEDKEKED
eukprot:TRINITY_DN20324_c0_g1_i1.p1 TRINITY_DN20324_c0_g1~~TRINITY_DN20324_c0_g1_i1.p1  ORF type:complete len:340 (-),score=76.63 TRINITY_DN20324_c0_g1_i1:3-989(-)